ncbi:SDR family NAD(P)-dependent oxidoreductase [Treponema zuelzerae]|uniref:SDR family NAD(P)-dependent oxidoreductase n=1 Tax=Teretinema zuelzerae TaxID=156 RepID=A0AAE3EMN6_9SPIR|nr:SDR family NAD(P)-dependent oxidoreductase [Teretinema zuelzerae]MCD1656089.1 SDR family NAD(P)-dependent oxidoreductase [Teretinema zuelzerae]
MKILNGKVALVTGASRGIGKGTAIALAKEGAKVYITGRTIEENTSSSNLPGSIYTTEKEINDNYGTCIAIQCDHTQDDQTQKVVKKIKKENDSLDILVNAVWGGYEYFTDGSTFWTEQGFWDMPFQRWDKMFDAGVRAHFVTSSMVSKIMINQKKGLIINYSFWAADRNDKGVAYSVAKAATNKMTECMAYELSKYNVSVITLYPGLVRTESVMKNSQYFDMSNSESTEFSGKVISKIACDKDNILLSGKKYTSAELALKYNIQDIDGKQPVPLTVDKC